MWREWGLQPWRTESFKFSTDPQQAKGRDVIGLYLNPPDKAVVLCVDEKPQTQALERKAPVLPMQPGIPEKRSHDYIRHGTTALFAGVEAATGKVTGAEDRAAPACRNSCNSSSRSPRPTRGCRCTSSATTTVSIPTRTYGPGWPRHPRITLHFTPTSGSWLNMAEVFFSIITRQAIRRGSFTSVKDLIAAIEAFINGGTTAATPSPGPRPPTISRSAAQVKGPRSHDTRDAMEHEGGVDAGLRVHACRCHLPRRL